MFFLRSTKNRLISVINYLELKLPKVFYKQTSSLTSLTSLAKYLVGTTVHQSNGIEYGRPRLRLSNKHIALWHRSTRAPLPNLHISRQIKIKKL